jgi:hypothetical protein
MQGHHEQAKLHASLLLEGSCGLIVREGSRGVKQEEGRYQHSPCEDKAGTFARRLQREGESLGTFLDVYGVERVYHRCGCAVSCATSAPGD